MPSSGPFNFRLPSSANFVPKQLIDPSLSFFYHENKFGGRGYSGLFLPEVAIYRISCNLLSKNRPKFRNMFLAVCAL